MTFKNDLTSSFIKGIGRTIGALSIFGTLGLFYMAFTYTQNTYNQNTYNQNTDKQNTDKQNTDKQNTDKQNTDKQNTDKQNVLSKQEKQNVLIKQEKKNVEFDLSRKLDENRELNSDSETGEDLDKSIIEKKEIEIYEKNETFKKLFDKLK